MTLTIPFEQFNEKAKAPYLTGALKSIGIDYQYNSISGFLNKEEIEIFNFKKVFKLDNRYSTYQIYTNTKSITIEFNWKSGE